MGVLNAQFQNFKVVKHSNLNRKSNPSDSHWVPLISALHTYYIIVDYYYKVNDVAYEHNNLVIHNMLFLEGLKPNLNSQI